MQSDNCMKFWNNAQFMNSHRTYNLMTKVDKLQESFIPTFNLTPDLDYLNHVALNENTQTLTPLFPKWAQTEANFT